MTIKEFLKIAPKEFWIAVTFILFASAVLIVVSWIDGRIEMVWLFTAIDIGTILGVIGSYLTVKYIPEKHR